jgi:hypothetical protein
MSIVSQIAKQYDELSGKEFRNILKNCMVEDFSTEQIKLPETVEKTLESLKSEKEMSFVNTNGIVQMKLGDYLKSTRPILRAFLNYIFFSLDMLAITEGKEKKDVKEKGKVKKKEKRKDSKLSKDQIKRNKSFWFEYAYRFKKLTTVSLILERANLLSMNCKPEINDTPQCLKGLLQFIEHFYTSGTNKRMRDEYEKEIKEYNPESFLHFYYEGEEHFKKKMKK